MSDLGEVPKAEGVNSNQKNTLIIPEGGSFRSPQGASRRGNRRNLIMTLIRVRSTDLYNPYIHQG